MTIEHELVQKWIYDDLRAVVPVTIAFLVVNITGGIIFDWTISRSFMPALIAGLSYGVVELYKQPDEPVQMDGEQ